MASSSSSSSSSIDFSTAILIRVDQSGKGDFNKIQEAIESIPPNLNNSQLYFIWVKPGVYSDRFGKKQTLNTAHARFVDKTDNVIRGVPAAPTVVTGNGQDISAHPDKHVLDGNANTIINIIQNISEYSTPPSSPQNIQVGNKTPSIEGVAKPGFATPDPATDCGAMSAHSENHSRHTDNIIPLEDVNTVPPHFIETPSFSLGLTQEEHIRSAEPLTRQKVADLTTLSDINVGDNIAYPQSLRNSKRQKTLPPALVHDYLCGPHIDSRLHRPRESVFVCYERREIERKINVLSRKLSVNVSYSSYVGLRAEINKPWKLRSDASDQIWEVIREGRTLTKGWKEFTEAHDLRIGDIVIFKHEGDMVFHVTPFGPSCCEILWSDADDAPTFSYDYCFLAEVTPTNQKDDKMFLPVEAMRCGALNQQCKEVKLVNKEGKSWTARFGFSESDGAYYISRGWRKFCHDNRCTNGALLVFNVVGDGTTTPLLCVCPERKECTDLLINHFSRIDGSIASTSRN
uniref:TF-B3 domain-containing protein n=1 Tax=Brassica campestris TaxID=3711 RepID=M4ENB7_BRACM